MAVIGRDDEVVTLALAGEFDLAGADAFATALDEIEAMRPRARFLPMVDNPSGLPDGPG